VVAASCLAWTGSALAQPSPAGRPARSFLFEAGPGYAEFVDSPPIPHATVTLGGRVYVSRRVAIGPEVSLMFGPGIDRDVLLTGNATIDLRNARTTAATLAFVPYIVAGAGFMTSRLQVGTGPYTSREPAWTVGAGARIAPARHWYIAPELRLGWELHWRTAVMVGVR
jgi:hypothetical protein